MKPAPPRASLRWAGAAARSALLLAIVLMAFPVRYHVIAPGLDASWAFALNWFAEQGLVHGRDIGFTYGPLAYLTLPMDIGGNLLRGVLFQTAWWLVFAGAAAWATVALRIPAWRLAVFAVLFAGGLRSFHDFGYSGPDMFMAFTALLLLGCALEGRRWAVFYAAAVFTAVVLFFVKLSAGILALSAAVAFAAGMAAFDRGRAARAAALAAAAPLLFAMLYLAYNPSLSDMLRYVRAGMEMSSGYSAAMGQDWNGGLWAAMGIGAAYAALAAALWWGRYSSWPLAVAGLGPLFLVFKHSFVRPVGHIEIFFRFAPLLFGVVLLFTTFRKCRWWALAAPLALFAVVWYPWAARPREFFNSRGLEAITRPAETRAALTAHSQAALAENRLPPELLDRIGGSTITVLPWEAAYAAANPLRYRPLPVFQSYTAYTPFLDGWNAQTLADASRAPECVLLEWDSIDGRHPLLDIPATALALWRHYDADSLHGERLLLRRRAGPRFLPPVFRGEAQFRMGEPLRFEDRGHPLIARLNLRPSPGGAARRFLLRVPEIRAMLSSGAGHVVSARVPPDVLSAGLPLNFTPATLSEARALFERNEAGAAYDALVLTGPGTSGYRSEVTVELWEIPGIELARAPEPLPPPGDYGAADAGRIELLNNRGVVGYGPGEVLEIPSPGYLVVSGWAIDQPRGEHAGGVWIELNGRLYPARHGLPRPYIASAFGKKLYDSGFEWTIPAWKLGTGVHELAMKVASADGKGRYSTRQRLRFRLKPS